MRSGTANQSSNEKSSSIIHQSLSQVLNLDLFLLQQTQFQMKNIGIIRVQVK